MNKQLGHLTTLFAFAALCVCSYAQETVRPIKPVKYVFLFIGDGMSQTQRSATEFFKGAITNEKIDGIPFNKLVMSTLPVQGMTTTYAKNAIITDSAAAATALACGQKTLSGTISMDAGKKTKLTSSAKAAKASGKKVGIVSSVSLDHATPACFYANQPSRNSYYEISRQLVTSNFDFFGGGQLKVNIPHTRGKNPDLIPVAKGNGFTVAYGKEEISKLQPGGKAIAFARHVGSGDAAMPYDIDRKDGDMSLADFTATAIRMLDNTNGFFLMVESGKIDWACHANDAATAIRDVLAFDNAIKVAMDFAKKHPEETLIVVTGDHETGGMTIGFAGTKYNSFPEKLNKQKMSYQQFNNTLSSLKKEKASFEKVQQVLAEDFGLDKLSPNEQAKLKAAYNKSFGIKDDSEIARLANYGYYEPVSVTATHLMNNRAGLCWTSYAHTGIPVTTSSYGVNSNLFSGMSDNTDIGKQIKQIVAQK